MVGAENGDVVGGGRTPFFVEFLLEFVVVNSEMKRYFAPSFLHSAMMSFMRAPFANCPVGGNRTLILERRLFLNVPGVNSFAEKTARSHIRGFMLLISPPTMALATMFLNDLYIRNAMLRLC